MSAEAEVVVKKLNIIKEHLIALCALKKLPKGEEELIKFLNEDIQVKNLNTQHLSSLCYYILGIIDVENRDKSIGWPLINIQSQTKFRKGVTAMVKSLQDRYPWANIKKLPESYLVHPHGYASRVIDFLLRLTNLAIHISLDEPELLMMQSGENLKTKDVTIMTEIISLARRREESILSKNIFSVEEFENTKHEIITKCICLRQENDELQHQLASLYKLAVTEGFVPVGGKLEINELKIIRDEKLVQLNSVNEELSRYCKASQELSFRLQAVKNPVNMTAKDFGSGTEHLNLSQSTSNVCQNLYQLFQCIKSKNLTQEEAVQFYEKLQEVKGFLIKQKESYEDFLSKMSSLCLEN